MPVTIIGCGIVRSDRCDVWLSRSVGLGTVIFWQSSKPLDLVLLFLTERMMRTARAGPSDNSRSGSVTAFACMLWSVADGWISQRVGIVRPPCLFFDQVADRGCCRRGMDGISNQALNRFAKWGWGKCPRPKRPSYWRQEPLWAALFRGLCGCQRKTWLTITWRTLDCYDLLVYILASGVHLCS
jgi:hypothetical protein